MHCTVCNGPLVLLGHLGRLSHYRCRSCGMDHSHEFENVQELGDGVIAWDDKLTPQN